jgi:hypothetical protein
LNHLNENCFTVVTDYTNKISSMYVPWCENDKVQQMKLKKKKNIPIWLKAINSKIIKLSVIEKNKNKISHNHSAKFE